MQCKRACPLYPCKRDCSRPVRFPFKTDGGCEAFEKQDHERMRTFYMLGRYTGQRRGDCCDMRKRDLNLATSEMYVMQEKTGTKIWVPCPQRLLDYLAPVLATLDDDDCILQSPKGGGYRATSVTNIVCTAALGFKTTDSKGKVRGYSPHGLRHLCGAELAESGCTTREIMSVLGHLTEKEAARYVAQADRRRMGHSARRKRDAMYEQQAREAAIDAAANVTKLAG